MSLKNILITLIIMDLGFNIGHIQTNPVNPNLNI